MDEQRDATRMGMVQTEEDGAYTDRMQDIATDANAATGNGARWGGDTTIRETPGVCGGYPRVGRTRISVRLIIEVYRKTGNDFTQTAEAFPQLTHEQIRAALDYYQAHPARVDEDITRNARTLAEHKGGQWSASE